MFFRDKPTDDVDGGTFPLLPLRDVVVFPDSNLSLIVGRPRSVAAIQAARDGDKRIVLITQKAAERVDPAPDDLHAIGTLARIEQVLHLPDRNLKVIVAGLQRVEVDRFLDHPAHFQVMVRSVPDTGDASALVQLARAVKTTFERYLRINRAVPQEMLMTVNALDAPGRLADALVPILQFKLTERQQLLATTDVKQRLERVHEALQHEIEFLQVERKLRSRSQRQQKAEEEERGFGDRAQRMQQEMGDQAGRGELDELARALEAKELPEAVRARADKELRKLQQMNLMSAEATVLRNYLDVIVELPWTETSTGERSLARARGVLDDDHFGLHSIKQRILEYLAVETLVDRMRGPILCLAGPPGVGKTSLARSIARATGRPFVRVSLGGVRDEAEIRGHRRTYIGAMPGKLVNAMKRAGTVDPVILLDEIDKMSSDFRGDPSSALLEVLDPEQNAAFVDHYLDLDYDLSRVTFVCTANELSAIPEPLRDRLEVLELSGYTDQEKVAIARRYLVPKQMELHGLNDEQVELSNKALFRMVREFTREAGVRELERQVARVCRKVARHVVEQQHEADGPAKVTVTSTNLPQVLGVPRFDASRRETDDLVGLVRGLAWNRYGGALLEVEVAAVPGKGNLILTGRLGDTLKESANAAFTYIRSRAEALRLDADFHETHDFHVHYPGLPGGVDGPSAGIAMATSLVSALTGLPVRADTAMTGEITLRGRVLPIGGLKEKLLAARRGGITRVLIPERNHKDLSEIPGYIQEGFEIIEVSHMDRVLMEALAGPLSAEILGPFGTTDRFAVDSPQAERPPKPGVRGD